MIDGALMILFAPVRKNLRTRLTKKHCPRSSLPDKGHFGMVFYFENMIGIENESK
jgi:hypothetical protein